MEQKDLQSIVAQFNIEGNVTEVKPLGNGLINTTYKVVTEGAAPDYVLQHVNNAIFPDVEMLMGNIVAVTGHIRAKYEAAGVDDIARKVLSFVQAKDGKYFYFDGEKYWRVMVFIPDTISQSAVTPESSYIVGETFGNFQAMLADIPVQLGETIKDFHNMEFRLWQLREAVKENKVGRLAEVQWLVDELEKRAEVMCKGEQLHREGKLAKRICHCDTKVDNILFDQDGKVLCVIDLDTVMPNFIFSDFGDFLRSAANTGKEDDKDLDNVNFNMDIFKAFTEGYLKSARCFLTPLEIENLPYAAALFPYMQTVRFLADYINGDTYYKTQYAEHNLVRSKAQFKLLQSVEAATPAMQAFIAEQLA
ncbi:MAG: aminoglycoside phosphotransferase family protein [Bacteroidaceae bacterium]|nr:aminoglycoside phosphotransferase family protein [Bacteroidaceae bacterium]MBQ5835186.1 aminoglycoside phosphotransferase family protein [Bacteroidaceae bacterium]MBQ5910371.1 aminoglycoside phosphotransferase family protein [Bacteroidaceae bacterium]MBR4936205.1 aminoglycoside phosphotransferase family protein [Bacteroidaceae bacterium]MBR5530601.1 aminoglycoside phosphotransferase family protein [Bacteroidaceae bacterium]